MENSKMLLDPSLNLDKELTNKFLCGQISFADYSTEWYSQDDEDMEVESDKSDEEEPNSLEVGQAEDKSVQLTDKSLTRRRKLTRLSAALLGLMGEANLRFVRGDKEVAEKMCHEIIKQVPTAPEPYQTLAQIYEDDTEKSLQFSLLAAHLSPPDANEWLRLAAISKQRNDVRQEMICYSQAVRAEPHNINIHLKRLDKLIELEEMKYPINTLSLNKVKCYHKIVNSLLPSEGEIILKYAKMAVAIYHNNKEIERALQVMTTAYKKCSEKFTLQDTNNYLELLIACKQYQPCLDIFVSKVGVEIEAEIQTVRNANNEVEEHTNYLQCTIPNDLPIDLKSNLLICFVYLGAYSLVENLLKEFLTNDVEKAGDLYMDIEEALSSVGQHELAIKLLEPLVKNTSFDLGAVWLKYGECLYNLGREDDAVESYKKVLKCAPQYPDARRKLFEILERKGMIDEALEYLQQDYKYVVSGSLLREQSLILKKYNKMLKYLDVGEALLSKTFGRYRHQDELKIACKLRGCIDLLYSFRTNRGENPYHEDDLHFDENESFKLTAEEEWDLFKELMEISLKHKQYFRMQRLSFGAFMSKNLTVHRQQLEFYCLQSALLACDYHNAFRFTREVILKDPTLRAWNLLNLIIANAEENVHLKFLSRLFKKEDKISVLQSLFQGNKFFISGRYLVALKYYLDYHNQCREPLSALLIGITILVMATQRTVDKHHNLILQGLCYMLTYQNLRQCDQETYYNLGRAYQMLSINNLAIEYYERALNSGPVTECPTHGVISLTRECAYNLYILYKDHAPNIARQYMLKYLVV